MALMIINEETGIGVQNINKNDKIISLKHALSFALLLIFVRFITKSSLTFFGESGFLITSILGALTGIDAVTINLSELAGRMVTKEYALLALLCINATNMIGKIVFSAMYGKKDYTVKYFWASVFVIIVSFFGLFLFIY